MKDGLISRNRSYTMQILDILTDRISKGIYPANSKMPSQNDLAEEFNVSRATIRGALDMLAAHGIIDKRRGSGTWVKTGIPIFRQINRFRDLPVVIAEKGYRPGVVVKEVAEILPDENAREKFKIKKKKEKVLRMRFVFLANDIPIVYSETIIPLSIMGKTIKEEVISHPKNTAFSITNFLESDCNQEIKHFSSVLSADQLENCGFADDGQDVAALVFRETCINQNDEPLAIIKNYFIPGYINYNLIRTPVRYKIEPEDNVYLDFINN